MFESKFRSDAGRRSVGAVGLVLSSVALVAAIAAVALVFSREYQPDQVDFPIPSAAAPVVTAQVPPVRLAPVLLTPSAAAAQASPDYPVFLARSADDPRIARWLIEWRHHAADRDALAGLLAITRLDSLTLFRIGSAIHQVSHDDLTAASFFAAALSKANSLSSSREIVRAMIAAKPLLWQVVDSGHWQFVDPLYRLNIDLANRISAADQSLSNDRIHGAIGAAECLSLLGQFGPALAELDGFHAQRFTSDQKASIAWVRGQALFALHRYAAALDQFRIVSGVPTFKYSFDNCRMIVMALARQGDVARANAALDELIRSRRPTPSQIAPLLAAIGMGTSDH